MKLRAGLSYRTRDGHAAGPVAAARDPVHPWGGHVEGLEACYFWTDDGHFFASGKPHDLDLVERVQRSASKAIDQMTLADYRRAIAKFYRPAATGD